MKREIRLFGALRSYDREGRGRIELELSDELSTEDLKDRLADALGGRSSESGLGVGEELRTLLADSAVADSFRVLSPHEKLGGSRELAVLPPVCGG